MIVDILKLMNNVPEAHQHGEDAERTMAKVLAPLLGVSDQGITVTEGFFPEYDVEYSGGMTVEFKFSTTHRPIIEICREFGDPCGLTLSTADYTVFVCSGDAGKTSPVKVTTSHGKWVDVKVYVIPTDWLKRFYRNKKHLSSKMVLTEYPGISFYLKPRAFPNRFFAGRMKPVLNHKGNVYGFDTDTFIPNVKFSIEAL